MVHEVSFLFEILCHVPFRYRRIEILLIMFYHAALFGPVSSQEPLGFVSLV